jgi:hypothetical protein
MFFQAIVAREVIAVCGSQSATLTGADVYWLSQFLDLLPQTTST